MNKNYYLSFYKAIQDGDINKTIQLGLLSEKEQEDYPFEPTNLDYDEIFQENDADDFIEDFLKQSAIYQEFLIKLKEVSANYWLHGYSVASRGITYSDINEFMNLSYEDKINYPNKHPELDYDIIFQNNYPDDVLETFFDGFTLAPPQDDFDFLVLKVEKSLTELKKNYDLLMNSPLLDYCPNPQEGPAVIDYLLSITYSTTINASKAREIFQALHEKSSILRELFTAISLNYDFPFTIKLLNNADDATIFLGDHVGGHHNKMTHSILIDASANTINKGYLTHEMTHHLINLLFNQSNPYTSSPDMQDKYHQAIRKILFNIINFVKEEFNLNIKTEENETTWEIGKKISSILFPQYLNTGSLDKLIEWYKENNIDFNDKLPWLNYKNLMYQILAFNKTDLAEELIKKSAIIPDDILIDAAYVNHQNLISWILKNADAKIVNYVDKLDNIAIDYASEQQIIDQLIAHGSELGDHCNIIPTFFYKLDKSLTSDTELTLKAIESFLMLYNQNDNYEETQEDAEFIVRLPQIIATDLYSGKVITIFEPAMRYWQEEISSAIAL